MLGGMAGGLIDPETLQGAQFSGRSIAGSESGLGRAIIFGTTVVEGRLMDGEDEPRVTRADVGKGGPEVENDVALLSYAIEICESSELRGTKVEAVIAVWEDEKLVYDVREGSLVSDADNAKWKKNKQFFYGEEGQMPSAMLQSIHGIGNVPAYVGTCRMDVEDEDLVLHGERIPRYRFLVSRCPVEPPNFLLVTGDGIGEGGPVFAAARATEAGELEFVGIEQSTGADLAYAIPGYDPQAKAWLAISREGVRVSFDNRISWDTRTVTDPTAQNMQQLVRGGDGWLAQDGMSNPTTSFASDGDYNFEMVTRTLAVPDINQQTMLDSPSRAFSDGSRYYVSTGYTLIRASSPYGPWECVFEDFYDPEPRIIWFTSAIDDGTKLWACTFTGYSDESGQVRWSPDDGVTWPDANIVVSQTIGIDPTPHKPVQLHRVGAHLIAYCEGGGIWTSANGWASWIDVGLEGPAGIPTFDRIEYGPYVAGLGDIAFIIGWIAGESYCVTFDVETLAISAPVPLPITNVRGIAAGVAGEVAGGGIVVPDAPGYYLDPITGEVLGPDSDIGNACGMYLDEVVREIYRLGSKQLTDDMLDLSALAPYYVRGYALQEVGLTSADGIEPLRRVYFFDLPEYDGKIHARLRAGDIDWTIDPDDIIPGEESTLEGKRGDETKYPKKLQLTYAAISTDYKPTTQTAEDINPDTFTNTEESYQAALVLEDDEAAKVADVMLKVMRIEREDEQKFSLPIQYIGIIASDILSIEGRRYRVDKMRVEKNRVVIERAVRDSQHAYYSDAVGVEGIQRPPPVSSVRGPVASAVMNMPVLRDTDDKAGIYWAGAGYLPGFRGSMLQMSRDGINFENGPELSVSSTMGLLTADLPEASRYVQDNTNVLKVRMYPGGRDLDSTTFEGLMEERNVAAIVYPDGTTEIIQFQIAVEGADREYELTGLMRGRQDTISGEHLTGAQFVLLNEDVRFVAIRPDDVGKTLTFRAVSRGTNPEDNATQVITFTTIESLREWQPYNVVVTPDGLGGYCVACIARARLGSSRTPVHSQWYEGLRYTFTRLGAVYIVDTTEQAICVDAATLAANGILGAPTVTVRARSRVATNDDDFDSPPAGPGTPEAPNTGDPMTDPDYSAPDWQEQGAFTDWYEGEPLYTKGDGSDDFVFKGSNTAGVNVGGITANVCAASASTSASGINGFSARGIPLSAHTATADARFISDVADGEPHQGNITDSVAFATKPTYSIDNWMGRGDGYGAGMVATTPPGTTLRVLGNGASLESRAEFDSGKINAEFTAVGITDQRLTMLGLVAAAPGTPSDPGTVVGSWLKAIPADGTYTVRVNADVSPATIEIENGAGTILHTGSLLLPAGKVFRFRRTGLQKNVTIKANYGNESWINPLDVGYAGLPNMATVCAVQWDGRTNKTFQISADGKYGPLTNCSGVLTAGGTGVMLGSLGKSSGLHRVRFFDDSRADKQRLGLCLSGQTGMLGTTGTSIGYRNSNVAERFHELRWTWGGGGSATLPAGFDTPEVGLVHSRPTELVYGINFGTAEIHIWIAEQDQYNVIKPLRFWLTIPGVPPGTYFPAIWASFQGSAGLFHDADEPAGFDDWTETH